jgi:hypothetical protein
VWGWAAIGVTGIGAGLLIRRSSLFGGVGDDDAQAVEDQTPEGYLPGPQLNTGYVPLPTGAAPAPPGPGRPTTNAEWQVAAVDWLVTQRVSGTLASNAIAKFLQGVKLDVPETAAVNMAVQHLGAPPEGAPPVEVTPPPPPTPTPNPPPVPRPKPVPLVGIGYQRLVKTGRETYEVNFVPTAGANAFRWRRIQGGTGSAYVTVSAASALIPSGPYKGTAKVRGTARFAKPTRFAVGISARNSAGQWGPEARTNEITLP